MKGSKSAILPTLLGDMLSVKFLCSVIMVS